MQQNAVRRLLMRKFRPAALSPKVLPHSVGCQIRHLIQLAHIYAAVLSKSFVCTYDGSNFLWGNFFIYWDDC